VTIAEDVGSQYWLWSSAALLASTHIAKGQLEQAQEVLATVIQLQAPHQTLAQRLAWFVRGEWALAAGDASTALQIVDQLIASAANLSADQAIPCLSKLRGQALAVLGRMDEAETEFQAALTSAQAQGALPLAWRICAALGQLYADNHRSEAANEQFAAARQIVEQLATRIPDPALRAGFVSRATSTWQI
jgi:tetratricopeptide (TPR) repeat protein